MPEHFQQLFPLELNDFCCLLLYKCEASFLVYFVTEVNISMIVEKNHVADCEGSLVKIVIVKESGEKKEIEAEEVSSNATTKIPAKWKNRIEKDSKDEQAEAQPQSAANEGKVAQAQKVVSSSSVSLFLLPNSCC